MIDFETAGERESFLSDNCPPMGIYETLYAFRDAFGSFMDTLVHSIATYSNNPKIITELSIHQSYEIREALVLNPNTNLDILEKFLNDDSPTVVIETVSQILNRDKPKEKLKALLVAITEIKEFKNSTEDPAYYIERAAEKLKELD